MTLSPRQDNVFRRREHKYCYPREKGVHLSLVKAMPVLESGFPHIILLYPNYPQRCLLEQPELFSVNHGHINTLYELRVV